MVTPCLCDRAGAVADENVEAVYGNQMQLGAGIGSNVSQLLIHQAAARAAAAGRLLPGNDLQTLEEAAVDAKIISRLLLNDQNDSLGEAAARAFAAGVCLSFVMVLLLQSL